MERYIYDFTKLNGFILKLLELRWQHGYYGDKIYLLYGALP